MQQKPEILIVEDQFVEANHLRLMLTRAGYPVCGIARSVEDAREIIAVRVPGLVLLDIFLSGEGTGIELAGELRQAQIPFIYLSANSGEETLNAAKATQPYGFLVKPFREKDLLVTMAIARHHEESGLQSQIRKETLFRQQVRRLPEECDDPERCVLQLARALQPLVPFDYFMTRFPTGGEDGGSAWLRIGFDEYQMIGDEEMQTITRLKAHEIRRFRQEMPADPAIVLATGDAFRGRCRHGNIEKLIADTFGMQAQLLLPVPLLISGRGHCLFSFFSRQPQGFTQEHVAIGERLQESLIYTVEKLLPANGSPIAGGGASRHSTPKDAAATAKKNAAKTGFEGIIGRSPLLLTVFDHVAQVAPTDTSVLITGESGTGKESIAEAIHRLSPRRNAPLIKVNCAALPGSLAESELFGHERGAFTGAIDRRIGRFEQAHHGTLFLDEVGDMPLEIQAKLLRALQEQVVERLGASASIRVDTRIIAATNRNLEKEVAAGRFRLDLYYRLNVFPIHLPPLRQRPEDIIALTRHFLDKYSRKSGKPVTHVSNAALQRLLAYCWPGNIRELENLIHRSVLLARSDVLEEIPLPLPVNAQQHVGGTDWHTNTIRENERAHILAVLQKCNGRIRGSGGAAELLGVPPTTLASKMQRLGIKRSHF
ncbi:MAG TPA: sigma 54-interacting response regulator [Puia sp.]|uniref:sigma 54-interacting response regulator n=1 Tax=Puia sp. TaxID=2045100 RepID=UPI002BFDBBB9|nr:sigma 54-interacting response regulator [Puia sp.]HVU95256.1 sigma 54-interacting response regulator [Puia sp.]